MVVKQKTMGKGIAKNNEYKSPDLQFIAYAVRMEVFETSGMSAEKIFSTDWLNDPEEV